MCGIIGSFICNISSDQDYRMETALADLHHRGPDDQGLEFFNFTFGRLSLGHTRLSIIDLSPNGHQPMHSPDGQYTIVFNGEIYNYRELRQDLKLLGHVFHTDSDTEVLLAAWRQWGVDGLQRLTGMFAFVIFDSVSMTLTLVRDAFGIKPLYYWLDGNSIVFSSEIPALLKLIHERITFNSKCVYDYLVFGKYDNTSNTFYKNIKSLMPGHWIKFDLQNVKTGNPLRWWWPSIECKVDLSFKDAAIKLREMFLENIALHLRSDVPLGAALSGGMDSSAVVCAMRFLKPDMPIHTFSFIARGSEVDEECWVDMVNKHIRAIPHKVVVDPIELGYDMDDIIKVQGEPFGSTSIYAQYRVFRLASEKGIKVTLDGQGADELLAGYNGYPHGYLRSMFDKHRFNEVYGFLNAWSKWPGRSKNEAILLLARQLMAKKGSSVFSNIIGQKPPDWISRQWIDESYVDTNISELVLNSTEGYGRRLVEQLREALTGNGLAALLRHADRNSMRWSIESRVPFLTKDMAEYLLSLPEEYLLSISGETKSIFREAMRGIVPNEILSRKDKIGFSTPEFSWFRYLYKDILKWIEIADDISFINTGVIRNKINEMYAGRIRYDLYIWRIINFCRWFQMNL